MTVSSEMVERAREAYLLSSGGGLAKMRAALTAALSDQPGTEKELTLVRSQLAECHKEIFKLREALLAAPASTAGEVKDA